MGGELFHTFLYLRLGQHSGWDIIGAQYMFVELDGVEK